MSQHTAYANLADAQVWKMRKAAATQLAGARVGYGCAFRWPARTDALQVNSQHFNVAPVYPAAVPANAPPPRNVPVWLTAEGALQLYKWTAVPNVILGVVLISLGAVYYSSSCPASTTLPAADIAWGASFLVGTLYWGMQLLVHRNGGMTMTGAVLSSASSGIWLWVVIAIFQDNLFNRVFSIGDAAACDPGLYKPTAVIILMQFALSGVVTVGFCGLACCVIPAAALLGGAAAGRDAAPLESAV